MQILVRYSPFEQRAQLNAAKTVILNDTLCGQVIRSSVLSTSWVKQSGQKN